MPFDGTRLDAVTKLLILGRERIEQGWCQHAIRQRGAFCMLGALIAANTDAFASINGDAYFGATRRLERAAGTVELPLWNDAPERTKDEVLAVYDTAISLG